jgi:hypothetical protein
MKTSYLMTLCMALVVGVAVIAGLANALGKTDEQAPIADTWVVTGPQVHVQIKNGQVMLRRRVNVDGKPLSPVKARWSLTTTVDPLCLRVFLPAV